MDGCRKSRPNRNSIPRTAQPVASSYTDWAEVPSKDKFITAFLIWWTVCKLPWDGMLVPVVRIYPRSLKRYILFTSTWTSLPPDTNHCKKTYILWTSSALLQTDFITPTDILSRNFNVFHKPRTFLHKVKVKVTLVQALRLCTGRTAHRGSRGIALL